MRMTVTLCVVFQVDIFLLSISLVTLGHPIYMAICAFRAEKKENTRCMITENTINHLNGSASASNSKGGVVYANSGFQQ